LVGSVVSEIYLGNKTLLYNKYRNREREKKEGNENTR